MVKIRKQPWWTNPTYLSFVGVVLACCLILIVWALLPRPSRVVAKQRDVTDVVVTWRCLNGHEFQALGSSKLRTCPYCFAFSDVVLTYQCPTHGSVSVFVRYRTGRNGTTRLAEYSFDRRTWVPATTTPVCPHCPEELKP